MLLDGRKGKVSARDCVPGTYLYSSCGSVPAAGSDPPCQPGSWSRSWSSPSVRGDQAVPVGTAVTLVSSLSLPCEVTCRVLGPCMKKEHFAGRCRGRRAAGPVCGRMGFVGAARIRQVGRAAASCQSCRGAASLPSAPGQAPRRPGTCHGGCQPRPPAGEPRPPPPARTAACCCPSARAVSAGDSTWGHRPGPPKALASSPLPRQPAWSCRWISSGSLSP